MARLARRRFDWPLLVEVRGSGDKLSEDQKSWIAENAKTLHLPFELETRDVTAHLGRWGVGRASEVRLIAQLAVFDTRRALRRDFDAYVSLAAYLDELHAGLRARRIFDPPCCGGYTACAEGEI